MTLGFHENAGIEAQEAPAQHGIRVMTPAGLQANADLARRRHLVLVLNVATYIVLVSLAASVLSAGGWTVTGWLMLLGYAVGTPWVVLGFWNAVLGLWLRHGIRDGLAKAAPFLAAGETLAPIFAKTAILLTIRNENPARAILRLKIVKASIEATGEGAHFDYAILSDSDESHAAVEEAAVADWRKQETGPAPIVYRRRALNTGFKAGNVQDFCANQGTAYDLMVPLDADSLMTGPAILRLVRIMQAYPRIGIVQSLVVGTPSTSAFTRLFQFGMRHRMRAYTMGQSWWTADCGPFWGHNAIVRIAPFRDFCRLPIVPGGPPFGGHVLSHDQVEAALMRTAGFEVRVSPEEGGSYEDNPPTLLDYMKRDLRWCQGNLQYSALLDQLKLEPLSRFQLVWAVLMFAGLPGSTLILALLPLAAAHFIQVANFPVGLAIGLYATHLTMQLSPTLAGLMDAALTAGEVARFGGAARFAAGAICEIVFSLLQGALTAFNATMFILRHAVFGRNVAWGAQTRDAYAVTWREAAHALWPQTLFGILVCGSVWAISKPALVWSLPMTAGFLLAIPFCVVTSSPRLGAWMTRWGLAGIPEDFDKPAEITAVEFAAVH